jgi:multicomponent Na+:H+ antiporter subunit F
LVNVILTIAGAFTFLAVLLSFLRLLRGPDFMNRAVALDALTIMCLSVILALSYFLGRSLYIDVALVYGLISFIGVVAVARYAEGGL